MSHPKARLTVHGRLLLVHRVTVEGWAVAHAAKAMGISRQCAHRWINRYRTEGSAGLADRPSAPHHHPNQTPAHLEQLVIALRQAERHGPDWIAAHTGVPARTVTRILRRHHVPYLHELDPLTGAVVRASKTTAVRYEHDHPGSLVHTDVKKSGRIPDGGGWKLHGRQMGSTAARKKTRIGYDYVHSLVDDHSRYAYCEVLSDEKALTTAAFLARAFDAFAAAGIRVERLMSDNHWSYARNLALADRMRATSRWPIVCAQPRAGRSYARNLALADLLSQRGIKHVLIRPHCPWQNGKVERFNRTLQVE